MEETTTGLTPALAKLLRANAPIEDAGRPLSESVRSVAGADLLRLQTPLASVRLLVSVAEANLPVARIIEGHFNARYLLELHAPDMIDDSAILGVWGADGPMPTCAAGERLAGGKRYASGLGTVTQAIVTVGGGPTGRLALVDVSDVRRHGHGTWAMAGMRATASGDIDLTGLRPHWIGRPGVYMAEPSFLGGVWRIAALQLGGTLGLLEAARDHLDAAGRLEAEAQVARLSPLIGRALAAFGLVERAAVVAQGPEGAVDPERAVALSIQARLLTEDLAQDAIAAVERSVGLPHFAEGARTGRIARDLATYCRQAARDSMLQRAGLTMLSRPGPLSQVWHG